MAFISLWLMRCLLTVTSSIVVCVKDGHDYGIHIYPRQVTDDFALYYQTFAAHCHAFFCPSSPVSLFLLPTNPFPLASLMERLFVAFSLHAIPPVATTRLLAEVVPVFEPVALATVPPQNFIGYHTLLSAV